MTRRKEGASNFRPLRCVQHENVVSNSVYVYRPRPRPAIKIAVNKEKYT